MAKIIGPTAFATQITQAIEMVFLFYGQLYWLLMVFQRSLMTLLFWNDYIYGPQILYGSPLYPALFALLHLFSGICSVYRVDIYSISSHGVVLKVILEQFPS